MTNEFVTNVVSHDITGLDLVNSVNGFYSGAFDKLFQLVLCIVGFVGVVLPILLPFYQKWLMRAELKTQLGKQMDNVKAEITGKIGEKFKDEKTETEEKFKALETLIKKEAHAATSNMFYVAAKNSEDEGRFKEALNLDVQAIKQGVLYSNFIGVQHFIRHTTKSVLPKMNKEHFSDVQFVSEIEAVMKSAGAANPLLQIDVDAFNAALEKAKNLDK
jgi:Tfp pilus assembly major pilin PilA